MTYWQHDVAEAWLEARRECITATQLSDLRPELKRWKKNGAKGPSAKCAALWEKKACPVKAGDTTSYGAAARGHYMEPYAIASWNKSFPDEMFHHWDDCVIQNRGVGFSPDGCDVAQKPGVVSMEMHRGYLYDEENMECELPTKIIEVKSYEIDHHVENMLKPKGELKERYQIAAAMLVCPSIKEGILLNYNPAAMHSMVINRYSRDELQAEIEELEECLNMWAHTCRHMESLPPGATSAFTEAEIIEAYESEQHNSDKIKLH